MSLFSKLKSGLNDAIEFEEGHKKSASRVRNVSVTLNPIEEMPPKKIKKFRIQHKLNQRLFANLMGVSPETVAKWEQGSNKPKGSSLRLLQVMEKHPEIIDELSNHL